MSRFRAVVVAAGEGRRFGGPKQFAALRGRPVLDWSLAAFEANPFIDSIVLVLANTGQGGKYVAATARSRRSSAAASGAWTRWPTASRG